MRSKNVFIIFVLVIALLALTACSSQDSVPTELTTDMITLSYSTVEYDGTAKTPGVSIVVDGKSISADLYTVTYSNNTEVGTASVVIAAKDSDKISGTVTLTFKITAAQITHNFSDEWSKDETSHWHACTDEGFATLKADADDHTYIADDEGTAAAPATCLAAGYTGDEVCSVCGHKKVGTAIARLAVWDGTSVDTTWYNAEDTSFTLSYAAELAGLAKLVNEGNDFAGKTITLDSDIYLNNKAWTPIGFGSRKASTLVAFAGTFDGGNYTIRNLFIDYEVGETTDVCVGLFGNVKNATIKNVKVIADITTTDDGAAGIVAYGIGEILIDNCVVDGKIEGIDGVGGIIGRAYCDARTTAVDTKTLTISNCTNNAEIKAQIKAAGIVAAISGIGGFYKTVTLSDCINNGTITSVETSEALVGVQWIDGDADSYKPSAAMFSYISVPGMEGYSVTFTDCKNTNASVAGREYATVCSNYGFITITNTNYEDVVA